MDRIEYITTRRARFMGVSGPANVPWGTPVQAVDGFLVLNDVPLCAVTSQNAYDYFARNDDGNGMERGQLTASIIARLSTRDKDHQARWNKVWEDPRYEKYRRQDSPDFWLWGHAFFEAPVEDLRHIADLVGAKKGARK